jgi:hypothetical protein
MRHSLARARDPGHARRPSPVARVLAPADLVVLVNGDCRAAGRSRSCAAGRATVRPTAARDPPGPSTADTGAFGGGVAVNDAPDRHPSRPARARIGACLPGAHVFARALALGRPPRSPTSCATSTVFTRDRGTDRGADHERGGTTRHRALPRRRLDWAARTARDAERPVVEAGPPSTPGQRAPPVVLAGARRRRAARSRGARPGSRDRAAKLPRERARRRGLGVPFPPAARTDLSPTRHQNPPQWRA